MLDGRREEVRQRSDLDMDKSIELDDALVRETQEATGEKTERKP